MTRSVAVIGGGPAGLRAAEVASEAGAEVTLYDHKPSVGRKFLVAGKSGLNLTNAADFEAFCSKYSGGFFPKELWRTFLKDFNNRAMTEWASGLGVETFVASGGKVFPSSKKAAPLLRRWILRLKAGGVDFKMNHRFTGLRQLSGGVGLEFECKGIVIDRSYDAVILALGGGSWPQTGSDGHWSSILSSLGVALVPMQSANCGWECDWSTKTLSIAEGQPLHHLELRVGKEVAQGELMVTRYGFEGTPIYRLGKALRDVPEPLLEIDFKPMFTVAHMVKKMESARRNFFREARLRWKLSEAACAIIEQCYGEFDSAELLARAAKSCQIPLSGARPIEESISTAGGVSWTALNQSLMLKILPGVFCAGEMIDWEAPTGGYLIQGCFATGSVAGKAAAMGF